MDAGVVEVPGGPFGTLDAGGAIRWMLEQFQAVALATGAPIDVGAVPLTATQSATPLSAMIVSQRSLAGLLPAALLGIVAFTLVLIITEPPGPGLDPDALQYMGAAESLAAHLEYRVPTAEWARP